MDKKAIKNRICHNFSRLLAMIVKTEQIVFFESFNGRHYSDNPKAISVKLHELFPEFEIRWSVSKNNTDDIPDYVKTVKKGSFQYFLSLAKSFCYVTNEAVSSEKYKKEDQIYIQTWHGDRGIKKILYDSLRDRGIKRDDYVDGLLTDIMIAGSDYAEKRIPSAFQYYGRIEKIGCPRNDLLLNPKGIEEIKKKIGIPTNSKVLLYAPTLRRNSKIVNTGVSLEETLKHLEYKRESWICLVRAHPKSLGLSLNNNAEVIDVSKYPDMADLLMIADMLITDYSSSAGDFILRKKPVILAQFDLEQYMKEDRTFFVDIEKIGYIITHNQEELNKIIDTWTDEMYEENCESIMKFFGVHESGESATFVCKMIKEEYDKKFGNG